MTNSFWRKQTPAQPLFPDIIWNKPEQRSRAGTLAIIGGSRLGFVAVNDAFVTAEKLGVGQIRAVLPDVLKSTIPTTIESALFIASNTSGGFSRSAIPEIIATAAWADAVLLVGDMGRNSETAMVCEQLLEHYDQHVVITRDVIELIKPIMQHTLERTNTTFVMSFAQTQKVFQSVYYPRVLSFSMHLMHFIDALHKFTVTYPATIVTFHQDQLIVAHNGAVISQEFHEPMHIWRGLTAARATSYIVWNPQKPLEAIASSFLYDER